MLSGREGTVLSPCCTLISRRSLEQRAVQVLLQLVHQPLLLPGRQLVRQVGGGGDHVRLVLPEAEQADAALSFVLHIQRAARPPLHGLDLGEHTDPRVAPHGASPAAAAGEQLGRGGVGAQHVPEAHGRHLALCFVQQLIKHHEVAWLVDV